MRCSKCQYISFDNSDRCRNCGYEFSLAVNADDVMDLPIRSADEPTGPLIDFSLSGVEGPVGPPPSVSSRPPAQRRDASMRVTPSGELPLFHGGSRDDAPLVSLPAVPRVPVSVRKSTAVARPPEPHRPVFEEFELDLESEDEDDQDHDLGHDYGAGDQAEVAPGPPAHHAAPATASESDAAGVIPRICAAMVDLGLLVGMDVLVLHLTLKLCGLELRDATAIPVIPFAAFLLLLNGGYVAAFTAAGGQTIGKMLAGIRVVMSENGAGTGRVPVGSAALRALGYLISALPAGLGFLPVLLGAERRGFHDRLAHTRVVKA